MHTTDLVAKRPLWKGVLICHTQAPPMLQGQTLSNIYTWTCPSVVDIQHFPSWLATHLRPMCSVTPLGGHVLNSESLASLSSLEQSDAESVCNCYRASRRQIKSTDWEFLAWRITLHNQFNWEAGATPTVLTVMALEVQTVQKAGLHQCAPSLQSYHGSLRASCMCFCLLFNHHCFPLLQVSSLIWTKSAVR